MKKLIFLILKLVQGLVIALAIYVAAALVLSMIPINTDFQSVSNGAAGTDIYVRSNGVHTDIVLPLNDEIRALIPQADLHNGDGALKYVSFGWGDKGFYLETPTWSDLKASTAFVAAFGLGSTAMHVEALDAPVVGENVRRVRITDAQLAILMAHIKSSFIYDAQGAVERINTTANYNEHDAFYEAHGRYSLFTTCNEWTRKGLSLAGIRTAVFSPHEAGILRHLPQ
jgi:uncharacterized protein (TIGR02117 family)